MRSMIIRTVELTGYAGIRSVFVSVPLVPCLLDGVKYMLPADVKPPEDNTEARRKRAPRGPSLRSLVKLAVRCESAEEMGRRLRRRYQRQQQRMARGDVTARQSWHSDNAMRSDGMSASPPISGLGRSAA